MKALRKIIMPCLLVFCMTATAFINVSANQQSNIITSIEVIGIIPPEVGETPTQVSDVRIVADGNTAVTVNVDSITWLDEQDAPHEGVFAAGKAYSAMVYYFLPDGYTMADPFTVTADGCNADSTNGGNGDGDNTYIAHIYYPATAVSYGIRVSGTLITDKNISVACGNGTATFNPETSTLTLNNAIITNENGSGIFSSRENLTIELIGQNSIECTGTGLDTYASDENWNTITNNITLTGGGSLEIVASGEWDGYGTYVKNLTINNAELSVASACTCLWAGENINIIDSKITAVQVANFFGVVTNKGTITVTNSDIAISRTTMAGSDSNSAGIYLTGMDNRSEFILNSGNVTIAAAPYAFPYGIAASYDENDTSCFGGSITINGGSLNITAGTVATDSSSVTVNAPAETKTGNTSEKSWTVASPPIVFDGENISVLCYAPKDSVLVLASYNGQRMLDVKFLHEDFTTTVTESGLNRTGADTVKVMLWKSTQSLMPLCEYKMHSYNE